LLPAIQQSRGAARRAACQSNLRQWALAMQNYAEVHGGCLPYRGQGIQPTTTLDRAADWFNALPPYLESEPYFHLVNRPQTPKVGDRSVWVCPEAEEPQQIGQKGYFSYGMNMALSVHSANVADHIDRVGPTHTMVFMADGPGAFCAVIPDAAPYSPIA